MSRVLAAVLVVQLLAAAAGGQDEAPGELRVFETSSLKVSQDGRRIAVVTGTYDVGPGGQIAIFAAAGTPVTLRVEGDDGQTTEDEAGGPEGPTACILLDTSGLNRLEITIAIPSGADGEITLRVIPMPDGEKLRRLTRAGDSVLADLEQAATAGKPLEVLPRLVEVIDRYLAVEAGKETLRWAQELRRLAHSAQRHGDNARGLAALERALATGTRLLPARHSWLQKARYAVASYHSQAGDLERARRLLGELIEDLESYCADDHVLLREPRRTLGSLLTDLGEYDAARVILEKHVACLSRTAAPVDPHLLRARASLANVYSKLGDHLEVKRILEPVVEIEEREFGEDHVGLQVHRTYLATALKYLGDLDGARILQERIVAALGKTLSEDHAFLHGSRMNLALTLKRLDRLEEARALIAKALAGFERILPPDHPHVLGAKQNLANILLRESDAEKSRELHREILDARLATLPPDHPQILATKSNLARVRFFLRELDEARALYEEMIREDLKTRDAADLRVLRHRSDLCWIRYAEEDDEALLETLLDFCDGMMLRLRRHEGTLEPRRMAAMATALHINLDTALSVAPACLEDGDSEWAEIFALVEKIRACGTTGYRVDRLIAEHAGDDEAFEQLRGRVAAASARMAQLAQSDASKHEVHEAIRAKELAQRELREHFSDLPAIRAALRDPGAELIRSRLADGEVAVGYWRYHKRDVTADTTGWPSREPWYMAFVLRADGELTRVDLGPAGPIDGAVQAWRALIGAPVERGLEETDEKTDGVSAESEASAALRALVLDPVLAAAGEAKRLWIAPDSSLHLVPLAALSRADGSFVGDDVEIVVVPALADLVHDPAGTDSGHSVLAVGGIDYDGIAAEEPAAERGALWERGFSVLINSEAEARSVAYYFDKSFDASLPDRRAPRVLAGEAATTASFRELAPRMRYIHLATHGYFAPDAVGRDGDGADEHGEFAVTSKSDVIESFSPLLLCGLAFAGANLPPEKGGGAAALLSGEELAALDLSGAELVVLSACDTNVGLVASGRGVASLQKSLHAAGVHCAITSLWPVGDRAATELMKDFYRRIWRLGQTRTAALRAAQRSLRERRDGRGRPLYRTRDWAPWVLSGRPD